MKVTPPAAEAGVFSPDGELTVDSVGGLLKTLLPGVTDGDIAVLDLGRARRADSAALALIFSARRAAFAAGRRLAVRGIPPDLAALAELYGVETLLAESTEAYDLA